MKKIEAFTIDFLVRMSWNISLEEMFMLTDKNIPDLEQRASILLSNIQIVMKRMIIIVPKNMDISLFNERPKHVMLLGVDVIKYLQYIFKQLKFKKFYRLFKEEVQKIKEKILYKGVTTLED